MELANYMLISANFILCWINTHIFKAVGPILTQSQAVKWGPPLQIPVNNPTLSNTALISV